MSQQNVGFRFLPEQVLTVKTCDISVTGKRLAPEVVAYLIAYGLKQSVDDAGADPEKAAVGSQTRFDNLMSGKVPTGGFGKRVERVFALSRDKIAALAKIKRPAKAMPDWAAVERVGKKANINVAAVRAWAEGIAKAERIDDAATFIATTGAMKSDD